jgi:glycosyltransferase involved in cell wall biosynthesis
MQPALSIVVCTYNRQKFITACLEHLAAQSLPAGQWEAIVVDNASTDQTASLVQAFMQAHPQVPLRYVYEAQKGLSHARNRGIAEARAPIVSFIDDDAEAVPGFAAELLHFFDTHPHAAGAGGRVLPKYSEKPEPAWMNKYLNGYIGKVDHGEGPIRRFAGRMKYPIGCNMAYRKALLLQAGGFRPDLTFRGDDKYIFYAVSAINPQVYYLHQALVHHNIDAHRLEFDYFKKLFLKTGNEERRRIGTGGTIAVLAKLAEYMAKWAVSVGLWGVFTLRGQYSKGLYTMYSQWFTLQGFLTREVFVR